MTLEDNESDGAFFTEEKKDGNDADDDGSKHVFDIGIIEDEDNEEDEDKNKVVKFADDEAEKNDARRDKERSRQELLSKIARLTETLNDTQKQIQTEKDKRKKKEKSLLKLAKELKKRNLQKEKDEDRMGKLDEKKKYLEYHWVLAQKELDQEKALHTKLHEESQKEYEEVIKEEKVKYERTVQENENRLADLKKAHIEQCEELGREALKSNLEADRLHSELAARGMDIPRRLLFNKDNNQVNGGILSRLLRSLVFFLFILSSIGYFLLGKNAAEIFTQSGYCAPVIPGTILDDNAYGIFQSPWWAPTPLKEQAFSTFCTESESNSTETTRTYIPSSIEWTRDGMNNKLAVSIEGALVLKKSAAKTKITSNKIQFWKRNGQAEEVPFNWSLIN